ncbi:hypothetical protein NIES4102_32800 [Chondrocystis sp. NIES-4102]|nr:hypothetical protein NIES4102_32800 [Chondrocystis sp. NIES-4102]
MLPLIMAACGAAGAVIGVLTTQAANEQDKQAVERYKKVNAELINSRDKLQQRYYELCDRSKKQINHLNLKLAESEMEKDLVYLALSLYHELMALREDIDINPSLKVLVEFHKAIALTNYVLKQLDKRLVPVAQDYFTRTLTRIDERDNLSKKQLFNFMALLMNPQQDTIISFLSEVQNQMLSQQTVEEEQYINNVITIEPEKYYISQEHTIDESKDIIQLLKQVPGMTDAHHRDFPRSELFITSKSGISVRTWRNPVNVLHVFVTDNYGELIFGGYVGWIHTDGLLACLREIKRNFK